MQMQGKGRRKRKDPQSRDFTCMCGKSYLSYAAAYTHAKNKHQGQKQYIEGIGKPQRQQLKRGRPKEKKVKTQSQETALLTLIESTILKICELVEGAFPRTILQGNEERNQAEFEAHFTSLCREYRQESISCINCDSRVDLFLKALLKDFCSDIAARVKLATIVLWLNPQAISQLNDYSQLWKERKGINQIIASALNEWKKLDSQDELNNQPPNDFDI